MYAFVVWDIVITMIAVGVVVYLTTKARRLEERVTYLETDVDALLEVPRRRRHRI